MPTHRYCPSCGDERLFDSPSCLDDHGDDHAEAYCVDCGTAFFVDPLTVARPHRPALFSAA